MGEISESLKEVTAKGRQLEGQLTEAGEQERALLRQIEDLEGGGATLDRRLKEVHASLKETEGALNDKQTETIRLMGVVSTCEQQIKSLGNDLQESRDAGETLTGKLAGSSEEAVELRSLLSVEREERAEDARIAAAAAKDLTDLRAQLEAATQQHAATSKHLERSVNLTGLCAISSFLGGASGRLFGCLTCFSGRFRSICRTSFWPDC